MMLRSVANRLQFLAPRLVFPTPRKRESSVQCFTSNMPISSHESDAEFDKRWEAFFSNPDIDHWEVRQGINFLAGMDLIPEPKIQIAILKACRRLCDYALAVRYLESMKDKADAASKDIYPYILQEINPVLEELGIDTPEKLGYDKPELAMANVMNTVHNTLVLSCELFK